jgi:hypothetical protein
MAIYYTGLGAKKDGNHTVDEFLKTMDTHFYKDCAEHMSQYISDDNYKPCLKYKELNLKAMKYNLKHNKPCIRSKSTEKKYKNLFNKCLKYKKSRKKRCDLDEYVRFSGAKRIK